MNHPSDQFFRSLVLECWRTFTSLELVLAGVLPWGNESRDRDRDRDKASSGDKISKGSFSWTTVPSLTSCERPSLLL